MLQTTSPSTTSPSPLNVPFDPTCVLQQADFNFGYVSYDPETSVLIYKQARELSTQPVQFVLPMVIDGHTVEVQSATGIGILPQNGQILLPTLTLYQESSIEITFTPTSAAAKPPKPTIKVDIRVPPRGGG